MEPEVDDPQGNDAPEEPEGIRKVLGGLENRILRTGAIAVAIGAIAAIAFGAYHLLAGHSSPPAALSASFDNLLVEPNLSLREFVAENGTHATFLSKVPGYEKQAFFAQKGVIVNFELSIVGPPGRTLHITESLFTASNRLVNDRPAIIPDERFVTLAKHGSGPDSTWVAYPLRPGRYLIRLLLIDANGDVLARAFTRSFMVTKTQAQIAS